jgi:hypothetical protein
MAIDALLVYKKAGNAIIRGLLLMHAIRHKQGA